MGKVLYRQLVESWDLGCVFLSKFNMRGDDKLGHRVSGTTKHYDQVIRVVRCTTFKLMGKAALEEAVTLGCHLGLWRWAGCVRVNAQGLLFSLSLFSSANLMPLEYYYLPTPGWLLLVSTEKAVIVSN